METELPPADQDRRERISRTGLADTLFVDAGAGSGKTTQLVERILHLVVDSAPEDELRLADVAAITFTEAAARELQDRVRVRFEEEAERADEGSELRRRCLRAVDDIDLAAITTLHGFARRLLAEHPVEAGLPLSVDILDEVRSELAAEDRWRRFVDELHTRDDMVAVLERAHLLKIDLEPAYPGHSTLRDVAAVLTQAWDRLDAVADRVHGPLQPLDFTGFDRAVSALEAGLSDCSDPSDKFAVHIRDVLLPLLRSLRGLDDDDAVVAMATLGKLPRGRGGAPKKWGGPLPRHLIDEIDGEVAALVGTASDAVLTRLLTEVARDVRAAAHSRTEAGALEFHDLLVLATSMLRTHPGVRAEVHDRYRRLLLDEFQDTDPLQIEMAALIAGTVDGVVEPDRWRDIDVPAGRLFFVGDPKQSIYRFRRADIALFLAARERFGDGGGRCSLTTNFRTVAPIIDWVNDLFGTLLREEEGAQPAYEPLVAHRSADAARHAPVLIGGPREGARAGELREAEAADVAAVVADVRDHPDRWPVQDPGSGWRPARLADVTILVPTRTSLPYLREALDSAEIPYRLDTGPLVYDSQEVRDLLAVVRAVADPTDQRSVVAALRSPLFGCSDRDLFDFRAAGGRWDPRADTPIVLPDDHRVVEAMGSLRAHHDRRWWTSPAELLDRIVAERHAYLLGFAHDRPTDVWRRIRFVVDQARDFEAAAGNSLRDYLAWADLQQSSTARVHEPLLPETDDDAVRIMTVHGAKGLEFPITVLSGLTTRPVGNRPGVSVLWNDDMPEVRMRKGVSTIGHDRRADLEAAMDTHEKLRLLYVACTRARDHLVVSAHHKAGEASYAGQLWENVDRSRCREIELAPAGPPTTPRPVPPPPVDDRDAWAAAREALVAPHRQPVAVSATRIAAEATDHALADRDDVDGAPVDGDGMPLSQRRRGRAGTAIGRAVHACLQFVDFDRPDDLIALAREQAAAESIDAAGTVEALARAALGSEAVALARTHAHHRELFVAAPVAGRTVEGYVDLLVETPDGLVVVDYKTDDVSSSTLEAAVARYRLQGAAYAVALEAVTGQAVAEVRFVFCRPAGAIERSVDDLAGAMEEVRAFLAQPVQPM